MSITWPASPNASKPEVIQPEIAQLREPLLGLWRRNLPTASPHRLDWLYGSGRARALLFGEPGYEPTGAAGLMLRRMSIGGQIVDGGGAIDLNVDQTQRSVGPALTLVRAVIQSAEQDGRTVLYGMPNRSAAAVMKRAGYRELGEFSSWTKLLSSREKLQSVLPSTWAARLAAPVADTALRLMSTEWRSARPPSIVPESIATFDDRFDRLWHRAASRFDVAGERTADYLGWRFTSCPDLDYRIFTLSQRQSGELLGYVVWYADEGAVSVSDLFAVDDDGTSVLLAEFIRFVRHGRWSAIRFDCFGSPDFYRLLQAAGFNRRQNRHPVLCRTSDSAKTAIGGGNWYLTMADSDTDV